MVVCTTCKTHVAIGNWHVSIGNSCCEKDSVHKRHGSALTFSSVVKLFLVVVIEVKELVLIRHCHVPPVPTASTLRSVSCRSEAQKLQIRKLRRLRFGNHKALCCCAVTINESRGVKSGAGQNTTDQRKLCPNDELMLALHAGTPPPGGAGGV